MSILILFMFLCASKVIALRNTANFFKHIGFNTNCPGNTTYGYTTDCSLRCDNLNSIPQACTRLPYFGCTCKDGYIPLDTNHKPLVCLKVEDCPSNLTNTDCSGNTTFGSEPYFTKVCDFSNYQYMVNRSQFFGCICKDGYIPLTYPLPNKCVLERDCPKNPKVVYTGLHPNPPDNSATRNFEAELQMLNEKYGLKGPYSSSFSNASSANRVSTKSPPMAFVTPGEIKPTSGGDTQVQ